MARATTRRQAHAKQCLSVAPRTCASAASSACGLVCRASARGSAFAPPSPSLRAVVKGSQCNATARTPRAQGGRHDMARACQGRAGWAYAACAGRLGMDRARATRGVKVGSITPGGRAPAGPRHCSCACAAFAEATRRTPQPFSPQRAANSPSGGTQPPAATPHEDCHGNTSPVRASVCRARTAAKGPRHTGHT